jgi:hypothetical protein
VTYREQDPEAPTRIAETMNKLHADWMRRGARIAQFRMSSATWAALKREFDDEREGRAPSDCPASTDACRAADELRPRDPHGGAAMRIELPWWCHCGRRVAHIATGYEGVIRGVAVSDCGIELAMLWDKPPG